MGSWNGTCALSNLSINYGDRVVVLLLVDDGQTRGRRGIGGGFCGIQTTWRPFHVPLRGVYNDYGFADLDDTKEANDLFDYFQGDPFKNDKFRFYGREYDFSDYNVESASSILSSIERNIIQIKAESLSINSKLTDKGYIDESNIDYSYDEKWCELGFMMMHEIVYNACANTSDINEYVNSFNYGNVDNNDLINKLKIQVSEGKMDEDVFNDIIKIHSKSNLSKLKREMCDEGERWIFLNGNPSEEYIKSAFKTQLMMRQLRKFYSPQGGAGSQDDNTEDIIKLNKAIDIVIENRKEEYAYEEDEEE